MILALGLAILAWSPGCRSSSGPLPGARPVTADPQPAPPPGVLGQVSVGPLPQAFAGLTALGRALGAWDRETDVFFAEIRALAEGVSDLAAEVDWSRPLHVLILDGERLPGRFALLLPTPKPEAALKRLAARCTGSGKGTAWRFRGGGQGLIPCKFHVRGVPGGLVVARRGILVDALARYGHAVLDPRLRPAQAPAPATAAAEAQAKAATEATAKDRGAVGAAPPATVTLVEARAFLPALRVRFGLDAKKVAQWVDLAAMGIAVAAGDFTAAGDLKEDLRRLVAQLDSLQDVGIAFELGRGGLALRLFATGRRGGALAGFVANGAPAPLALHRRLEPGAAASLTIAGRPPRAGAGEKPGKAAKPRRGALASLVDLMIPRLPAAYRAPAKALLAALTGPGAGELSVALRHPGKGQLGLDLVLRHTDPAAARKALFDGVEGLLAALRGELGGKGTSPAGAGFQLTARRGPEVDRLDLAPTGGTAAMLAAALSLLVGAPALSVAVTHRGDAVVLSFGATAEGRAKALLAEVASGPVAPATTPGTPDAEAKAPKGAARTAPLPAPAGTLGRVTLSLLELGRLVPGLLPEEPPPPRSAGALLVAWGLAPADRQVQLRVLLPVGHLKALAPLWKALEARLEGSADSLSALLGEEDAEDAL